LNIGAELGSRLSPIPNRQRQIEITAILDELSYQHTNNNLLLIINIELLFDRTLKLDPLNLLKRLAHARRVVAVWPGEISNSRLVYAVIGHPEYQDYSLEGLIPFEIQ
jgi:hypothetical protein